MIIRRDTESVFVIITGFPSMLVDNRGSLVITKTIKKFSDLKVCGFGHHMSIHIYVWI